MKGIRLTEMIELGIGFSNPLLITYKVDIPAQTIEHPRTLSDIERLTFYLSDKEQLYPAHNILPKDVITYLTGQVVDQLVSFGLLAYEEPLA